MELGRHVIIDTLLKSENLSGQKYSEESKVCMWARCKSISKFVRWENR